MKLSDVQIKRIKPKAKPYKVSDGGGTVSLGHAFWWKDLALDLQN